MEDLQKLQDIGDAMKECSLCALGQSAPNPTLSTIKKFPEEYLAHIKDKKCPSGKCKHLISYFITEKCIGCGACSRQCPANCISGGVKERHVIDQNKCLKCGQCARTCKFNAIIKK
jgi:NADH-quinone oxidoreductase subunit F/NADP-reducing hydrogenase subunit HndC